MIQFTIKQFLLHHLQRQIIFFAIHEQQKNKYNIKEFMTILMIMSDYMITNKMNKTLKVNKSVFIMNLVKEEKRITDCISANFATYRASFVIDRSFPLN